MHPFTTFPYLLSLSFFVPTLFRVACAVVFALLAQFHVRERKAIDKLLLPLVGKLASSMTWLMIACEVTVALMLFVGWYTQIAAIIGAALALKLLVILPRTISPYGRMVAALLFVMSFSLIVTGAGAPALDLPL